MSEHSGIKAQAPQLLKLLSYCQLRASDPLTVNSLYQKIRTRNLEGPERKPVQLQRITVLPLLAGSMVSSNNLLFRVL